MATVRVYLCTYRRHALLPRALNSLVAQSFDDWVCEVHNDDPTDDFPRRLVREIADPRVRIVDHDRNLGIGATFNLVYQQTGEEFVSMLEDDNWWEPQFLEVMVDTMRAWPNVDLAWSNMRLWQEREDGSWLDTGENLWQREQAAEVELHFFPSLARISEARHSNGAMLVRTRRIRDFVIPDSTTSSAMEAVRERTFPHPLLFVPRVLANFALTRSTSRSLDLSDWMHSHLLLVASFLRNVPLDAPALRILWHLARTAETRSTNDLLLAGLLFKGARRVLRYATLGDVVRLMASLVRHPGRMRRTLRRIRRDAELLPFLDRWTTERVREAVAYGLTSFSPTTGNPQFRTRVPAANEQGTRQLVF